MATTTPNFGWSVPTSTDLVKDGATAIETLGDAIDASLLDLKGGTSGQVLAKNSNTDMDFIWVTDAGGDITGVTAGTGISGGGTSGTVTVTNSMATAIDAKGDLIGGTGADTFARLAVGANGTVLTADSAETTGLKWATPAASSFVGCRLLNSAAQSITNNTATNLTFDTETFDTDSFHSTSSNTSRITIPSGKAGKYLFIGSIGFDSSNGTGRRVMRIHKNGTIIDGSIYEGTANGSAFPGGTLSVIVDAAVSDYFEVNIFQNSGITINTWAPFSGFQCQYLGA